MVNRKGIGVAIIAALVVSVSAFAQKKDDKKQTDDQKAIRAMAIQADSADAVAVAPAPGVEDAARDWRRDVAACYALES